MLLAESSTATLSKTNNRCLEGEFATFDELNQNQRIYPRSIYEEALSKLMPKIESRSCLGECDHPTDYDEVRLSNVSHVITEVTTKGNKVYGKVELLNTPAGKIIESLVEAGVPIGISSRAVGDVKEVDGHEEVTSLDIITYDLVADPSFKDAILSETKKSELGESLKRIEKTLPLRESCGSSHARNMIKQIRESLLTDSREGVSNRSTPSQQDALIESMSKTIKEKSEKLVTIKDQCRSLIEENKFLRDKSKKSADDLKKVNTKLSETRTALTSLQGNMTKIQDAYNSLVETTVSRDSYTKLEEETVELRKRLAVESRGMTYSQVRDILEGATTTEEINKKLDSIRSRRSSSPIETITRSVESMNENRTNQIGSMKSNRLSDLVSRV